MSPVIALKPLARADARIIGAWPFSEPYELFSARLRDPEQLEECLDPSAGYSSLWSEQDELVGYCCVGAAARVPGGRYPEDDEEAPLDFGLALRPDLTGRGLGGDYAVAAMRLLARRHSACRLRVTVATWNQRALRLSRKLGFVRVAVFGGFRRVGAGHHVVLLRQTEGL